MVIAMATSGSLQRFHIAWLLCMGGTWFAVVLTGVVNPRYRFAFEPFCFLYAAFGLSLMCTNLGRIFRALAQKIKSKNASLSG
jgi:hypothetical protein